MERRFFDYCEALPGNVLSYTEFSASPVHRNRLTSIIDMVTRMALDPSRTCILEVGCGVGNIALPLAACGYRIEGIDIHDESIRIAEERNRFPHASFRCCDVRDVPVENYDVIILTEVIEHVAAYDQMMHMIASRTRANAKFIITVPNGWSLPEIALRPSYTLKRKKRGAAFINRIKKVLGARDLTTANLQTPHVNFFTLNRLRKAFKCWNLEPIYFSAYFGIWPLVETLFSERVGLKKIARIDFNASKCCPANLSALWTFMLQKKSG